MVVSPGHILRMKSVALFIFDSFSTVSLVPGPTGVLKVVFEAQHTKEPKTGWISQEIRNHMEYFSGENLLQTISSTSVGRKNENSEGSDAFPVPGTGGQREIPMFSDQRPLVLVQPLC